MERPTDDLLRRILAAAATEADAASVQRLVAEARTEAEEEVKGLLKSALKAALLRGAAEQLEAASSDRPREPIAPARVSPASEANDSRAPEQVEFAPEDRASAGEACYVYAITGAGPQKWLADTVGVDADRPLELVRHEELQAVVSRVSLEEFGQVGLDARATDPQWVEEKVRAHDRVIKSAMAAGGAVIPCRFCTVLRGADDVRRLVATHRDAIRATLAALDGKQEWGVKVYARPAAEVAREMAEAHAGSASDDPGAGGRTGTAYLQRRKHEDGLRAEAARAARSRAAACHEQLAAEADDAAVLPRRSRGNGGRWAEDEPVLNAAYLVSEVRTEQFHATVAEMSERHRPFGLEFEVTGPWPPYNFVRLDLSLGAAT
jgi:hypothetical protein